MLGTDQTELTVTHATEIFQPTSSSNERPNVHVRVVEAPPKYTSYEEEAQKPGRERRTALRGLNTSQLKSKG